MNQLNSNSNNNDNKTTHVQSTRTAKITLIFFNNVTFGYYFSSDLWL